MTQSERKELGVENRNEKETLLHFSGGFSWWSNVKLVKVTVKMVALYGTERRIPEGKMKQEMKIGEIEEEKLERKSKETGSKYK